MTALLRLAIVAESDRYRFARFVFEAVEAFGASAFSSASILVNLMPRLREDYRHVGARLEISLLVIEATLYCEWNGKRVSICRLDPVPDTQQLKILSEQLRLASESTDPGLLVRRNRQIEMELEHAKARAAAEFAELEARLESKKAELQASLRAAATDSLTGLYNRGAYDDRLMEAVMRCARQQEPLCLIMLDLDYFKQINDENGHQYGDEYLKRMAQVMREHVRSHVDIPCRMGGDEFAIMVFAGVETARRIAESILTGMLGRVSIGIACLLPSDSHESLIGRADAALYEAKRQGRGRVCVAVSEHAE